LKLLFFVFIFAPGGSTFRAVLVILFALFFFLQQIGAFNFLFVTPLFQRNQNRNRVQPPNPNDNQNNQNQGMEQQGGVANNDNNDNNDNNNNNNNNPQDNFPKSGLVPEILDFAIPLITSLSPGWVPPPPRQLPQNPQNQNNAQNNNDHEH